MYIIYILLFIIPHIYIYLYIIYTSHSVSHTHTSIYIYIPIYIYLYSTSISQACQRVSDCETLLSTVISACEVIWLPTLTVTEVSQYATWPKGMV